MTRPLRINNTSPLSLKEMSDADIAYITYRVLHEFANNQTGIGTINLTGTGTIIGSFTDTNRPYTVGAHPIGTNIDSNTIAFYQDRSSITPAPTRPVAWVSPGPSIKEISDNDLNGLVVERAANQLVSGGIGSYSLNTTTPTNGTWIIIDSFVDDAAGGDTIYNLYRKVNDTAPTVSRPLKTVAGGVREMSDTEINSIVDNLRSYINLTGIGYYALQDNAPSTGTWSSTGTVTDIRNNIGNQTYARFFSGTRVAYYTGLTLLSSQSTISSKTLWVRQS